MVAIFTGAGTGFERGSGAVLGSAGLLGSAFQGWGGERVSVNAATGNLLLQKQDEVLIGLGPDVGIARTYNSQTTLADDNNDKWRQSTDRRVYGLTGTLNAAGSTVKRASADGTEITYTWDGAASAYVAKDGGGAYDRIVKSGTEWVWTDGDSQGVERYETTGTGRIKSAADRNGLIIAFTYDAANRLDKATTSDGSWIRYDYSGAGLNVTQVVTGYTDLQTSTAKTLTRTRYGYDGSNRLTQESKAAFTDANGSSVTPTTTYAYNALGDLVGTSRLGTASGSYTAADRTTTYRYGEGGRLLSTQDAEGYYQTYFYDAAGRLKKTQYARIINTDDTVSGSGTTTVTEAKTSTYDLAGRALTTGVYSNGARIDFASFEYNAFDQVTRQGAGANGSGAMYQAENKYDGAGRLIATNAGDGVWKVFAYDKNGNQTGAITSAGAATSSSSTFSGLLASVGSADLNGTYTRYDGRGQATQVIEEGRDLSGTVTGQTLTTTRTYNAFGEIGSETNALGATVTYSYNAMGRKIRSESPGVSITDETGAAYWVKPSEDYYYDLGGRLVATRDANGAYATTGTGSGSATSKAANTGQLTTYVYLGASGYDGSQGLVTLETHADGGKKQTLYDRMGDARIVRDELYTPSLPNLHQEERSYNKLGQLIEIKHNRTTDVSGDSPRASSATSSTRAPSSPTTLPPRSATSTPPRPSHPPRRRRAAGSWGSSSSPSSPWR